MHLGTRPLFSAVSVLNSTKLETLTMHKWYQSGRMQHTYKPKCKHIHNEAIFHSGETSFYYWRYIFNVLFFHSLLVPIMYSFISSVGNRMQCSLCVHNNQSVFYSLYYYFFSSYYVLFHIFVHSFLFLSSFVCSSIHFFPLCKFFVWLHVYGHSSILQWSFVCVWLSLFTLIYTWIFCSQWHSSLSSSMFFFFSLSFFFSFFLLFSSLVNIFIHFVISCFRTILFTEIVSQT